MEKKASIAVTDRTQCDRSCCPRHQMGYSCNIIVTYYNQSAITVPGTGPQNINLSSLLWKFIILGNIHKHTRTETPLQFTDGHDIPRAHTWPAIVQRWSIAEHGKISEKISSWELTCSRGDHRKNNQCYIFLQKAGSLVEKCWKTSTMAVFSFQCWSCFPWPYFSRKTLKML